MDYLDNVWRSFRISWRHKYLWLIALFSGEGGGSGGFNFNGGTPPGTTTGAGGASNPPDMTAIQDQVTQFLSDYAGLIIGIAVVSLVVIVGFFILAAVCEGATVRSSAEHDADRPWGLRIAWRAGVHTMWPMIRFRLLLLALALPIIALAIAFPLAILFALTSENTSLTAGAFALGAILLLPVIVYAIYLSFLDRFGSRALVLEELGAKASIVRAHRLLFKRFGRSLLVWLLSIAVAIVVGIVAACAGALLFIPLLLIPVALFSSNPNGAIALSVAGVLVLLPIVLVIGGFLAAQTSTYWTVAFRRMEIDRPPVAYYPPAAPPAAPPA